VFVVTEDPYRKLAERLDAIPNGFPSTESGVELRLLAKIFTPEEAALAGVMRLTKEPAGSIASRAGWSPQEASRALKEMTRKGLILAGKGKGELVFGLMPFVVGIYEEQLPRLDEELATLFEEYYQETGGGGTLIQAAPPGQRVIPIEQSIPFEPEIFPYERASELLLGAKAWGVRDCICRVQQRLVGKGCDHPVEVCLVFAPVAGAFDHSDVTRAITKEEALSILWETEEAGLVHSTANFRDGHFYICNCCTCCCGFLRSVVEFGVPTAVAHSDFRAVVDQEECVGCAECVERCQFGALSVPDDLCVVDYARCVGCGQCTTVCPSEALRLERRPESERASVPLDRNEWMVQRSEARDIDLSEIL
jgi:electron transport complex protein RnfB